MSKEILEVDPQTWKLIKILGLSIEEIELNKKIVDGLEKEFIQCNEYPPLTKWFKAIKDL